jgi:8-oxo-dGTP pyrophosphatase MutT (NUDIX family)
LAGFYYRDPNAPTPNQPRHIGVAALIERNGELHLDRRRDPPAWSLIAGGVLDTESLADALRREVHEETGLVVSGYELFGTFSDPARIVQYADGNTYRFITIVYTVAVESFDGLRVSPESVELRFVPKAKTLDLDLAATHRPIIERLLSSKSPPYLD